MEVIVAVANAGAFAAAGAKLGMSPPAVTRAVAALEDRLGARLLNRTTRRLSLTEAGVRYVETTRRLLAEIEAAERSAGGASSAPRGHLTATCSVMFGRLHLVDLVSAFLREQPALTASVTLLDRVVDLVDEGVDVAVRIGALPDSSLVAARVGQTRRLLVAAPDYLARRGRPERPEDLKAHDIIAFSGLMPGQDLSLTAGSGRKATIALSPRLRLNDAAAAIDAAERGDGICLVLSYMVARQVRDGRLVPVLERFMPPAVPIQIVYPHARLLAPKIRAFVDFTASHLRAE
ncbi:LysR family transcriptional regulator [Roseivivax isoporae LMG 25204]|uniref:LysR family transcriptional regulator n=2 Tax=Roseivivax TaxID=93682 RepID=X7F993_9RHOB|nr:LysR family transcriptional regulator [Roseivivax isoporae LMG 25204]